MYRHSTQHIPDLDRPSIVRRFLAWSFAKWRVFWETDEERRIEREISKLATIRRLELREFRRFLERTGITSDEARRAMSYAARSGISTKGLTISIRGGTVFFEGNHLVSGGFGAYTTPGPSFEHSYPR